MEFRTTQNILLFNLHLLVVHLVLQEQKIYPCPPFNEFRILAVLNSISIFGTSSLVINCSLH